MFGTAKNKNTPPQFRSVHTILCQIVTGYKHDMEFRGNLTSCAKKPSLSFLRCCLQSFSGRFVKLTTHQTTVGNLGIRVYHLAI
eukprot:484438-Prorocentrum_minimum.AAC.3